MIFYVGYHIFLIERFFNHWLDGREREREDDMITQIQTIDFFYWEIIKNSSQKIKSFIIFFFILNSQFIDIFYLKSFNAIFYRTIEFTFLLEAGKVIKFRSHWFIELETRVSELFGASLLLFHVMDSTLSPKLFLKRKFLTTTYLLLAIIDFPTSSLLTN